MITKSARILLALPTLLLAMACNDTSVQPAPDHAAIASGKVVFEQTGQPAANVDVVLERCPCCDGAMMKSWTHSMMVQTDSTGCFMFEYMHDGQHNYRVAVDMPMRSATGQCYLRDLDQKDIVLYVPAP